MNGKDILSLLILKYAPTTYTINKYQITEISESTDYFIDHYLFEDSYMIGIGINTIIYYQEVEQLQEDANLTKVRVKNTDAYYGKLEKYNEENDNYDVYELLIFSKDYINYSITWNYIDDGKRSKHLDFIDYIDKNLIVIN